MVGLGVVQGSTEQLGKVVDSLKQLYGLRYIYCWHGLSCYWSGVSPYEKELEKYKARLVFSEVRCYFSSSAKACWLGMHLFQRSTCFGEGFFHVVVQKEVRSDAWR